MGVESHLDGRLFRAFNGGPPDTRMAEGAPRLSWPIIPEMLPS